MKNAKLMLALLGTFIVVAIVVAFNTKKFNAHFVCVGTLGSGVCDTRQNGTGITNGPANCAASTTCLTTNCPPAHTEPISDF